MKYNGTIYRPPVEANTFLIPITEGCSHNSCSFCSMYQGVPFRMVSEADVEEYLQDSAKQLGVYASRLRRVYFVGADPFALSAEKLIQRIELVKKYFPKVSVISMYARTDNIKSKSDKELQDLAEAGVNDLYIGVESGLNDVLENLNKGFSADETRAQCLRLNNAGIRHNGLLMLGTAGKGRGEEAAIASARLMNEIRPEKVLVNTMSSFVGTKLDEDIRQGRFVPADKIENLEEERMLLENLDLPDAYFSSAHPLNTIRIAGRLSKDKEAMLKEIDRGIKTIDIHSINRISRTGNL